MDNDNSNNDLITISGESMTLDQLNTNLNTLTDNIFSMLNVKQQIEQCLYFHPTLILLKIYFKHLLFILLQ